MAGGWLSDADAERLGYTLTSFDCGHRLAVREKTVRRDLLGVTPSDPSYLPHARVGQGSAYRVRPADLAEWMRKRGLPPDLVRETVAIEIYAGGHVSGKGAPVRYGRYRSRLVARLTAYFPVPDNPRYSEAAVKALRASDLADRITTLPTTAKRAKAAREARAKRDGLVNVEETAELANVKPATVRLRWGPEGRYGARKIDGRWFFVRDLVLTHRRPAAPEPPLERKCSFCGLPVRKQASKVRAALARAEKAGREAVFFHGECRDKPGARELVRANGGPISRSVSAAGREGYRANTKARWKSGVYDKEKQKRVWGDTRKRIAQSPVLRVKRAENWSKARWGKPLSEEARESLAKLARSCAASGAAGRKTDTTQRSILLGILGEEVLAEQDAATMSENDWLAWIGLVAWQREVGTLRADIPAAKDDPDTFDPRWRKTVIDRMRRHVGADVKALQTATT